MKQKMNKILSNLYNKSGIIRRTTDIGVVILVILGGIFWVMSIFLIVLAFMFLFAIEAILALPYCVVWFLFGKSWWGNIIAFVDDRMKLSEHLDF